jgi:transposase
MSTTRRVFPEVFKREAVDRVISSGLPVGKVATELGLNETVLRRWVMRLGPKPRRFDPKLLFVTR